jgi:hypothetical protein
MNMYWSTVFTIVCMGRNHCLFHGSVVWFDNNKNVPQPMMCDRLSFTVRPILGPFTKWNQIFLNGWGRFFHGKSIGHVMARLSRRKLLVKGAS